MPRASFRVRLVLLIVAILVLVQALTGVLVYTTTRARFIADGEAQLRSSAALFVNELDELAGRVAASVQVLALDFALRSAIAERDRETVLSVLRNHGRRVGATRMLLVGLDGVVEADTEADDTAAAATPPRPFQFPALVSSTEAPHRAAIVALDGKAYWMIAVPIYAPQPIAFVVAGIPIDDRLLTRMQRSAALPDAVELVARLQPERLTALARGEHSPHIVDALQPRGASLSDEPRAMQLDGGSYVAMAQRLDREGGTPVYALVAYSVDAALARYRVVGLIWFALLGLGLLVASIGVLVIAGGVARPLEQLAAVARRIGQGDYTPPPPLAARDEVGELATAVSAMAAGIRDREALLRHQALHDALTGLPNRSASDARIDADLAVAPAAPAALLLIGMARLDDALKTMGHGFVDRLLEQAAQVVRGVAAANFVARVSDTHFLVWLPGAALADAQAAAVRVLEPLSRPYQDGDVTLDLGAAVGIALAPQHGSQATPLLQHAEVALVQALAVAAPLRVYDARTDPYRPERLSLMGELGAAIAEGQLQLHYQAKLRLRDRRLHGAEALLRWQHPQRGMVPPEAFIVLAEETGNIRRLSAWVLGEATARLAALAARIDAPALAINLSSHDLGHPALVADVDALLRRHGLAGGQLTVEITESAVLREPELAIATLQGLAALGVRIAIDDFGVGQASFAYLQRLPVHELKIDRSFVQRLAEREADRIIVQAIIDLGHRLGYQVTAEGVEDAASLNLLRDMGCDSAQGFFISRPLPLDAFVSFCQSWSA